ncbi:unnamed protein product [Parnassius apollo]|uniref:(apollo) hypothetical protein n=1 Tax=Parnassius apollo TaxID=110799 RepID=A0A8S3Y6I8_PARAO|nr:unnamed protein product [Parnassius apollo]
MRSCYKYMLKELLNENEEACVEDAVMGSYSVVLGFDGKNEIGKNSKPVIVLEAGQEAGIESVNFALFIIEQLLACMEYSDMLKNVRWVILPNTNPDGREFSRYHKAPWKKNMRISEVDHSIGVDISRNFEYAFSECNRIVNGFSSQYPGNKAMSENETIFIANVLEKYKNNLRAYVSIRRDGHAILYPFASTSNSNANVDRVKEKAGEIVAKINKKAGFIQPLANNSIFEMNKKAHCGHSVDYVYNKYKQTYAYEFRVFLESDQRIITKFQALPRGYETTLRTGYFSVIKELYNIVVSDHKKSTASERVMFKG